MAGETDLLTARMRGSVAGWTARVIYQIGLRLDSGVGNFLSVTEAAVADVFVGALVFVACFRVVEIFAVELNDFRILALVFRMTDRAVFAFVLMIAAHFGNALGYLLVAVEAPLGRDLEVLVVAFHTVFNSRIDRVGKAQIARCVFSGVFLLGKSKQEKDRGKKE